MSRCFPIRSSRPYLYLLLLCFVFFSLTQITTADVCPADKALTPEECASECATVVGRPLCPRGPRDKPECPSSFFNEVTCCRKPQDPNRPIICDGEPKKLCGCVKGKVKGGSIAILIGITAVAVLIIFAVAYILFRRRGGARIRRQDQARIRLEEQARLEALKKNSLHDGGGGPTIFDPNDRKSNTQPPPGYPSQGSSTNQSSGPSPAPSYSPPLSHTPPTNPSASAPESYMVYPEHPPAPLAPLAPPTPPLHIPGSQGMYSQGYDSTPPMYNDAPPIHGYSTGYAVGPPPPPTLPASYNSEPYSEPYSDSYYDSGPPR